MNMYSTITNLVFYSISELSESQYYISRRRDVIDKILSVIATPKYCHDGIATTSLRLLMNLTHCKEAHEHLLKPDIVKKLIESMTCRSNYNTEFDNTKEMKGLQ